MRRASILFCFLAAVAPHVRADATARLEVLGLTPTGAALADAIAARQRPVVELLLTAHADVNGADPDGRTPLLAATVAGDSDIVPRLIAAGANPNRADRNGVTPLMIASGRGDLPVIRALLERRALLDAADCDGHTALHYAFAARRIEAAQHLLSLKPKPEVPCADGRDLLALAVETQDWRFIGPIVERRPAGGEWNFSARSALAQALAEKDADKVHLVLSKFAGPPAPEGCRQPLLAYAVAVNDLSLGRFLLEAGADPNTPVEGPLDPGFLEHIKPAFLRHYLAEENGMTILMVASGLGHADFVKLLLDRGANRFQATQSKYKLIPLYFAAWGEHAATLQVLLGNAPAPGEVRIEISLGSQNATLIRGGSPVFHTNISTGRKGFATPTGQFVVTDKKTEHVSTIYKVKMPFFMRLNCRDFGMHEGVVPDHPASHGCIRLPRDAARKLFKEVPIGTLVTITH